MDLRPAINTLLHSWGSDTPQEVFWGLNEMADIISASTGIQPIYLPDPLNSEEDEEEYSKVYNDFINQFNLNNTKKEQTHEY